MLLTTTDIHIWSTTLTLNAQEEEIKWPCLSRDEQERALRFRFPLHKERFIAARYALRYLLGRYLAIAPEEIKFGYTEQQKPYLSPYHHSLLNFNLAHSHDQAIFAFTLQHAIGIDIEKIKNYYPEGIAKRYFNPQEYHDLMQLPMPERTQAFYRVWSRKEALIKATGKGLAIPLSSFAVSVNPIAETILLENKEWSLFPVQAHPDYQASVASDRRTEITISYWYLE